VLHFLIENQVVNVLDPNSKIHNREGLEKKVGVNVEMSLVFTRKVRIINEIYLTYEEKIKTLGNACRALLGQV
jgi:wobble nucleotide-excising tRNase